MCEQIIHTHDTSLTSSRTERGHPVAGAGDRQSAFKKKLYINMHQPRQAARKD